MKKLLKTWSVLRILTLLLGVVALVLAIIQKDLSQGILGILLIIIAIADIGTSGIGKGHPFLKKK
ncbi:MAG: hypothetical protein ABIO76_11805 [Ginsengibacter sp.]